MKLADSQQLVRQQLGQARLLLDQLDGRSALPLRRACVQGALLSLNLGLEQYFSLALGQARKMSLGELVALSQPSSPTAVHEEFYSLMAQGGWLYELSLVITSMALLPPRGTAPESQPVNVIASSASTKLPPHWSRLDIDAVDDFVSKTSELVDRHSDSDIEY